MAGSRTSGRAYDEISHEIEQNFLSIRVPRDIREIQAVGNGNGFGTGSSNSVRVNCADVSGSTCREGCAKVNVIPNQQPPEKKPEEQSFFLRSKKQIIQSDELHHSLEIEFKAPRNYTPLPEPGPSPPIITIVAKAKVGKGRKKKEK
ncbi:uncharacterized protein LOC117169416 [Belonocnema kinseyi]|uniref:uncharacterized protein LOC117169416 n=1 Tax=Belonocnema kinseyi TaxID=2817044 RepID=UPI00143D197D|nr:uncharacterized protein LOC117169416 [Belonocnema kinseyi]